VIFDDWRRKRGAEEQRRRGEKEQRRRRAVKLSEVKLPGLYGHEDQGYSET
jgi:hypothetical protein